MKRIYFNHDPWNRRIPVELVDSSVTQKCILRTLKLVSPGSFKKALGGRVGKISGFGQLNFIRIEDLINVIRAENWLKEREKEVFLQDLSSLISEKNPKRLIQTYGVIYILTAVLFFLILLARMA